MNLSRLITGIGMLVIGAALAIIFIFVAVSVLLFYAIPIFIIGLFILFNKKEDEIEKIKWRKK